jgi:hypothetical protein
MERDRKRLSTIARVSSTLVETLDQVNDDRYFRHLMRVAADDFLARLICDDVVLAELTEHTRERLADWQVPNGMCPANEEPGIIRACARLEQLRRRDGLEVVYPVFPFHLRSYCRIRVAFSKKWHRLFGFHLLRLFRDAGPTINPLTDEQLRWIARSSRLRFPRPQNDLPSPSERVN